jgi:hypothetical protein
MNEDPNEDPSEQAAIRWAGLRGLDDRLEERAVELKRAALAGASPIPC